MERDGVGGACAAPCGAGLQSGLFEASPEGWVADADICTRSNSDGPGLTIIRRSTR